MDANAELNRWILERLKEKDSLQASAIPSQDDVEDDAELMELLIQESDLETVRVGVPEHSIVVEDKEKQYIEEDEELTMLLLKESDGSQYQITDTVPHDDSEDNELLDLLDELEELGPMRAVEESQEQSDEELSELLLNSFHEVDDIETQDVGGEDELNELLYKTLTKPHSPQTPNDEKEKEEWDKDMFNLAYDLLIDEIEAEVEEEERHDEIEEPIMQRTGAQSRVQVGRFMKLPPPPSAPQIAYDSTAMADLVAFDSNGYIFIRFWNPDTDETNDNSFIAGMVKMNQTYNGMDLNPLSVELDEIEIGHVLVARFTTSHESKEMNFFIRVQVVSIDSESHKVWTVNVDDHRMKEYTTCNLFWMIEEFHKIPTETLQCVLSGTEEFIGTSIVPDVLKATDFRCSGLRNNPSLAPPSFFCNVVKGPRHIPSAVLYNSKLELATQEWSFNNDVFQVLRQWNEKIQLEETMVLTKARITYATPEGRVWVQLRSDLMTWITNVQPRDEPRIYHAQSIQNSVLTLYKERVLKFIKKDGTTDPPTYRRVEIIPEDESYWMGDYASSPSRFRVKFVDYGYEDEFSLKQLLPYSEALFPDFLQHVPPQGFAAKLLLPEGRQLSPGCIETLLYDEYNVYIKELPKYEDSDSDPESACESINESDTDDTDEIEKGNYPGISNSSRSIRNNGLDPEDVHQDRPKTKNDKESLPLIMLYFKKILEPAYLETEPNQPYETAEHSDLEPIPSNPEHLPSASETSSLYDNDIDSCYERCTLPLQRSNTPIYPEGYHFHYNFDFPSPKMYQTHNEKMGFVNEPTPKPKPKPAFPF